MRFSSEIRWFWRGSVPTEVLDWFDRSGPVTKRPPSTDYYVNLGGSTTASIKRRGEWLEIKAMCPPLPAIWHNGRVTGLQNQWVKWSCTMDVATERRNTVGKGEWLAVWKSRSMRRFAFSPDGAGMGFVDGGQNETGQGCDVELTSMRVLRVDTISEPPADHLWEHTQYWWSLAFEAFGDRSRVIDYVQTVAVAQLNPPPPVRLEHLASEAYPSWFKDTQFQV